MSFRGGSTSNTRCALQKNGESKQHGAASPIDEVRLSRGGEACVCRLKKQEMPTGKEGFVPTDEGGIAFVGSTTLRFRKPSLIGVVEKPGPGIERVPLLLHGHRIDLTLSSRRRRRIEGRSPSTRSRCAPALPRYGARARLLGMREECRRGSNASDECQTE